MLRLLIPAFLFTLLACSDPEPVVQRGAYYWKTKLDWNIQDSLRFRELGLARLYCRYFDVAMVNGEIRPVAPVQGVDQVSQGFEIIPVVYITLDAIKSTNFDNLPALAQKMFAMVQRIHAQSGTPLTEIQIDCDWTASTRERYFGLLQEIKRIFPGTLSATIRLHQVKFARKTGVPPVDRGLLMFYNMGNPGLTGDHNAIIDKEIVASYTKSLGSYPITLDYAFPIFSWGALFRNQKLAGLIREISVDDVHKSALFKQSAPNRWIAVRSGSLSGVPIRKGDQIRLDASKPADVLDAVKQAATNGIFDSTTTVAFFSWDSLQMEQFQKQNIMRIYESFQ